MFTASSTAARLLPGLPVPDGRTVTTYHHASDSTPLREPTPVVDSIGAVLNTCVLSEVSRTYAPPGTALISTSVLGADGPGTGDAVLRPLAELYGTATSGRQQVAVRTVAGALPAMLPPWPLSRTARHGPGRYVCGGQPGHRFGAGCAGVGYARRAGGAGRLGASLMPPPSVIPFTLCTGSSADPMRHSGLSSLCRLFAIHATHLAFSLWWRLSAADAATPHALKERATDVVRYVVKVDMS